MLEFKASVHKVSTDKDGEVTVTFKVPESHAAQAISLSVLTKEVLDVKISKESDLPPGSLVEVPG